MPTEQIETSSLELAADAINYTLKRIRDDANIRYHLGAFTEGFERLKTAQAALTGISTEAIEQAIFSRQLNREPASKLLDELNEVIREHQDILSLNGSTGNFYRRAIEILDRR